MTRNITDDNGNMSARENLRDILDLASADERRAIAETWEQVDGVFTDEPLDERREAEVLQRLEVISGDREAQESAQPAQPRLSNPHQARRWRLHTLTRRVSVAAAAVVLLAGAAYLTGVLTQQRSQQAPVTYAANPGETSRVTLPDGTIAEINAGSSLVYEERRDRRVARLEGEAFFEVTSADAPFEVTTFNASVTVLGTRFNVRAWASDAEPSTAVALEEGIVSLRPLRSTSRDEPVTMQPGEKRRILSNSTVSDAEPIEGAMAWRDGGVFYRDAPLSSVLDDIGRRFAVGIALEAGEVAARRVNLALRSPGNAEEVVATLCAGYGLAYRETANGFSISTL